MPKVRVQAYWGTALIETLNVYLEQKCQTTPPSTFQNLANNKLVL